MVELGQVIEIIAEISYNLDQSKLKSHAGSECNTKELLMSNNTFYGSLLQHNMPVSGVPFEGAYAVLLSHCVYNKNNTVLEEHFADWRPKPVCTV